MTLAAYVLAALDSPSDESGAFERSRRDVRGVRADRAAAVPDETLLFEIQAGSELAFEQLFERYVEQLTIVASALVHSTDAADDIVQTVFLRLWHRRGAITIRGGVAQYLRSAIYNEAKNVLTSERRRLRRGERAQHDRDLNNRSLTPDLATEKRELAEIIERAIDALPTRAGEIFRIWFYTDLSYAEIAETLGISVKGVEQGRARAVAALRRTLLPFLREGGEQPER